MNNELTKKVESIITNLMESSDVVDAGRVFNTVDYIKSVIGSDKVDLVFGDAELTSYINDLSNDSSRIKVSDYIISQIKNQNSIGTYSVIPPQYRVESQELATSPANRQLQFDLAQDLDEDIRNVIYESPNYQIRTVVGYLNNKRANSVLILALPGYPLKIYSRLGGKISLFQSIGDATNMAKNIWNSIDGLMRDMGPNIQTSDLQAMLTQYGFNSGLSQIIQERNPYRINNVELSSSDFINLIGHELLSPIVSCYRDPSGNARCIVEDSFDGKYNAYVLLSDGMLSYEDCIDPIRVKSYLMKNLNSFTTRSTLEVSGVGKFFTSSYTEPPFKMSTDNSELNVTSNASYIVKENHLGDYTIELTTKDGSNTIHLVCPMTYHDVDAMIHTLIIKYKDLPLGDLTSTINRSLSFIGRVG